MTSVLQIPDNDFLSNHVKAQIKHDVVVGYCAGHRKKGKVELGRVKKMVKEEGKNA